MISPGISMNPGSYLEMETVSRHIVEEAVIPRDAHHRGADLAVEADRRTDVYCNPDTSSKYYPDNTYTSS